MSAWWETYGRPDGVDSSSPTASADLRPPADADVEGFHSYRSPGAPGRRARSITAATSSRSARCSTRWRPAKQAFPGDTSVADRRRDRVRHAAACRRSADPDAGGDRADRAQGAGEGSGQPLPERRGHARRTCDARAAVSSTSAGDVVLRRVRRAGDCCSAVAAARCSSPRRRRGWWWMRGGRSRHRSGTRSWSAASRTAPTTRTSTARCSQALTVHLGPVPVPGHRVGRTRAGDAPKMMGRQAGAPLTHAVAREACERLGASAMLEGSVSAVGRATVVALGASDCDDGRHHRARSGRGRAQGGRPQGGRAHRLVDARGRSASRSGRSSGTTCRFEEATTPSLDALKAFTAGVEKRAGRQRDRVDTVLRARHRARPATSPWPTPRSRASTAGSGKPGAARNTRGWRTSTAPTVSERERLFITYQYHDRVTGDQLKTREALDVWKQTYPLDYRPANALAVLLNRLGEYDRADRRGAGGAAAESRAPVPVLQPGLRLRGAGRYVEAKTHRRARCGARDRNGADAPAALSARGDGGRSYRGAAPAGLGARPARAASIWSARRRRSWPSTDG